MPNTPALYGAGASGYSLNKCSTKEDSKTVNCFLESVGISHELSENLIDAVTGVSGSGPAYIFILIEALADGGVK